MKKKKKKNQLRNYILLAAILVSVANSYFQDQSNTELIKQEEQLEVNPLSNQQVENQSLLDNEEIIIDLADIPEYTTEIYVAINDNNPQFSEDECTTTSFEYYSPLDSLDRVGVAYASIGTDIMPTEARESISSVYPTGWVQCYYDIVESGWLYNRSHLIGFQLTGENANECNLMTGTRYFNAEGMLLFENMVADYVKETGNHVMYRVTPYFEGDNLVAKGVQMEAYSVEDKGEGISFNMFVYNIQPGIVIDYRTGDNALQS
ncbi:MAG: DNA/RNA non-specific endonuclease [Erysipelotrichaceae bacterium]